MKRTISLWVLMLAAVGFIFAQPGSELEAATAFSGSSAGENAGAFQAFAAEQMRKDMEERGYREVSPASLPSLHSAVDAKTYELAYSDLSKASAEERQKILSARREVIESAGSYWVDDGRAYIVRVDNNGKTWSELPRFGELFPGWNPEDF